MVRLGYVSGNRMSHLQPRNIKLRERAVRIVMAETGVNKEVATSALESANWIVKHAVRQVSKPQIDTDKD
jgi:N-acetylmuramic acid 6-phosphate (MurNAc-6-P) etherase